MSEPALRAIHRALHVACAGKWKIADKIFSIGGIAILEIFSGIRRNPGAGNEVVELFHDVLCVLARQCITLDFLVEI